MPSQVTIPLSPHFTNLRGQGDRISSAAVAEKLVVADGEGYFVDDLGGHSWSFVPAPGAAVYGLTSRFKPSPIDHMANGVFLRVPFRRVPVLEAHSLEGLLAFASLIHSKDDSLKLMWRGQTREYLLTRPEEDSMRLYGEPQVSEPSLPSSGARLKVEFTTVFEQWSAILDTYIAEQILKKSLAGTRQRQDIVQGSQQFHSSYMYRLWAFATAQHYGLPSVGLDVTSDILVALLFALHRFSVDKATGTTTIARLDKDAEPVLYAMSAFENDLFDDSQLAPPWLLCERPKAQNAFFLATGWGQAPNRAAERIFVAIRLRNHTQWKLPSPVESLFPRRNKDSFLDFLLRSRVAYPSIASAAMLDRVYYRA
ncbi:FRG domain-containing protein [Acidicapsa acidisoli]|uniref:FRG domain-containing protein n=1 Tax=Acidicapsa acidisoli TaxID=1615681 RepID=UPI0021DFF995|nr:FRG domain-containing protein [Acidicapsa acidisoli]